MKCQYSCRTNEHVLARRAFLGSLAAGASTFGALSFGQPAFAKMMSSQHKRMIMIWLHGGVSQLETWDPKPGTDTGGPFRAIPTSVPGIHISELLPHTARQMHHMALIRSINTDEGDHGKGYYMMHTGRRQEPASEFPHLGAVAARYLAPADSPLPGYIHITPGGAGLSKADAAFLGPKYASLTLGNGAPPANVARSASVTEQADQARRQFRQLANDRFALRRRSAETEAYATSFEQAAQLMEKQELFDVTKEPESELERYGKTDFGRHCLLARRLVEHGVTFVKVAHSNYDTHNENFNFHLEQLGEFDRPFATLLDDLSQRGLLESTLVVVASEFGRTPSINHLYGRDHWGTAWSVALAGCGIQHGAIIGKTNDNGTQVADRQVHHGHLFHTYLKALGLDPSSQFDIAGRPIQLADPTATAIDELLA